MRLSSVTVKMACNNSAVLNVTTENKEIASLLKHNKENDISTTSTNSMHENSLIQSSSLDSFSTIQDVENLSELNMEEDSDFYVKIDSPQKHLDTLETYITFRITTKVARIEFSENEYVVRRRYNDFLWLRQKLTESHPFCIVPPLPGKHSLMGQLDRYSKDFIVMRMKALNVFITRVAQHPILSCNDHLKLFLTASQSDFNLHRRQRSTSDRTNSTRPGLSVYSNSVKHQHLEFDKTRTYLNVLSDKLTSIERISSRINKERQDLVSELQYFYPIFNTWASTEPEELGKILQSIASAMEKTANAQNAVISSYTSTIGNPVREFITYIDVVLDILQKREACQSVYESSLEELTKKRSEKDKLIAASQTVTPVSGFSLWRQPSFDDKLEKLGTFIPQLVKKVELNQDDLECANEQLRSDLEQWQAEKQQCIRKILLDFVNKQIDFYKKSVSAWENVTGKITTQMQTK